MEIKNKTPSGFPARKFSLKKVNFVAVFMEHLKSVWC